VAYQQGSAVRLTRTNYFDSLNRLTNNPRSAQYERARKSKFLSVAARRLGAHYFFRKPVDAQALIDAIQWVLDPEVQCAAEPQHQR
jgi:hypothetical protein